MQHGISSALHATISEAKEKDDVTGLGSGGGADGGADALKWEDSDNEEGAEAAEGGGGGVGAGATKKKVKRPTGPKSARQLLLIPGKNGILKVRRTLVECWLRCALGNEVCCDCSSPGPKWASINLGITLCIACSGVHRSMGVHVSKVRSLTLDAWEPEILKVMAELGNSIVNKIYEAQVHEIVAKRAHPNSDDQERENWIKTKYIAKAFVKGTALMMPSISTGNTGKV